MLKDGQDARTDQTSPERSVGSGGLPSHEAVAPADADISTQIDDMCANLCSSISQFDLREELPNYFSEDRELVVKVASVAKRDIDQGINIEESVKSLLNGHLKIFGSEDWAENELAKITRSIDYLINVEKNIERVSSALTHEGQPGSIKDESKFILLCEIANCDKKESNPEERGALMAYAYNETHSAEGEGFVGKIVKELHGGELDSQLAVHLLSNINKLPLENPTHIRQTGGINRMVRMAMLTSGKEELDQELVELITSPEALEMWPTDAKQLLEGKRREIARSVQGNINFCAKELSDRGLVLPNLDRGAVELWSETHFAKLEKKRTPKDGFVNTLKRRNSVKAQQPIQKELVEAKEVERAPNEVFLRVRTGERIELTPELMIEQAEKEFSMNPDLARDVTNILEYLKGIDLRHSEKSGLKKLVKDLGRTEDIKNFWEFKPGEATGFPTSTKITRRMRVIFSLDGGKFVVHGIANRDSLDTYLVNLKRSLKTN